MQIRLTKLFGVILILTCLAMTGNGTPGDLDSTFSGDGKLTDLFPGNGNDYANAVALQADGKIVVVGISDYGFDGACTISRFNTDGSPDASFAGTGKILAAPNDNRSNVCRAAAVQPDGKIIAAGLVFDEGNEEDFDFALFRFNADGSPDASFGTAGRIAISVSGTMREGANSIALQPDGKIVIAGYTNNFAATTSSDFALLRLNANGTLDTTFDGDGKLVTTTQSQASGANAVVIQPDGKIVAGGSTNSTSLGVGDFLVARYNADGSLDTTFDTDGKVITPVSGASTIYDIALQADGKIVVAGDSFNNTSSFNFTLARYNANGSLDTAFGGTGIVVSGVSNSGDGARAVALQPDGKIVAAGYSFRGTSLYDYVLVRFNTNGTRDSSFGTGGATTTQFTKSNAGFSDVAIQPDGKIVGTGYPYNGTDTDFTLFRYNANGTLDTTFDADGLAYADIGEAVAVGRAVVQQPDGKIVVAGYTNNGTDTDFAVARYNQDGSPDASFGGTGKVTTPILNSYDYANAVAIQPDGKIVVAGSAQSASSTVFAVARYNANGTLDTTFDTDGKLTTSFTGNTLYGAKGVVIQADGKIVAAGSAIVGSNTDFALARYNADGALDISFDSDGKVTTPILSSYDYGNAVALQTDGKIVVAGYTDSGSFNYDFAVARYNVNGSLDTSFDSDGKATTPILSGEDEANAVTIQSDGKIILAGYADNGTDFDFALARFNANGTLDTSFDSDGKVTTPIFVDEDSINAVAVQPDGKIIAAGYAATFTQEDFALARYNTNGSLDATYGAGGKIIFNFGGKGDIINGIALDNSGRAVAAGYASGRFAVARILGNSTVPSQRTQFDFDGDGRADVSVFRPSNGTWYLQQSSAGFNGTAFGAGSDRIVPADYDGDGKTDVAVFRPSNGTWYLQRSQLGFTGVAFGANGDLPVPADYDGDGKADVAVFRPSNGTWYLQQSTAGFTGVQFGQAGDKPVAADYDGDGKADVAVYRNGTWYLHRSSLGFTGIQFGDSNDKPVAADYDGDGKTDVAVFRPSNGTWYLQRSTAGFAGVVFGLETDLPTPADYDGDGKADVAVYRNGTWYLQRTQAGFTGVAFGAANDRPIPNAFVP